LNRNKRREGGKNQGILNIERQLLSFSGTNFIESSIFDRIFDKKEQNGSQEVEARTPAQEEDPVGAGHSVQLPILQPRKVLRSEDGQS